MITRLLWLGYVKIRDDAGPGRVLLRLGPPVKRLLFPRGVEGGVFGAARHDLPAHFPKPKRRTDPALKPLLEDLPPPQPRPRATPLAPLPDDVSFSVVINTLDRAESLRQTLLGLERQRYGDFEVIVVVGPCEDHTDEVLTDWAGRVKVVRCDVANLSVSRNLGISEAAGDVVCFIDDDAVPEPTWLAALAKAYAGTTVAAIGGAVRDWTGVSYQCRGLALDRLANEIPLSDTQAADPVQAPGAAAAPSTTGCNATFRRDALLAIGGFDEHYAYYLDESDVNFRLMDAGYRQVFALDAEVHHAAGESRQRRAARIPRNLHPAARSLAYFCVVNRDDRWTASKIQRRLEAYRHAHARSTAGWVEQGVLDPADRDALLEGLAAGLREGLQTARGQAARRLLIQPPHTPPAHLRFAKPGPAAPGFRIALISQESAIEPRNGIAVWTSGLAHALAAMGHEVAVISRSDTPSVRFIDGVWHHFVAPDPSAAPIPGIDLPSSVAAHARAVAQEVLRIEGLRGLDAVSGPIWDLEPIALLGTRAARLFVSLHTTYAMAAPFKPEWGPGTDYRSGFVDKMIAGERYLLEQAPELIANSEAIVEEIAVQYDMADLARKCHVIPHGVSDLSAEVRRPAPPKDGRLRVIFVGRLELRKGADLFLDALPLVLDGREDMEAVLVGDDTVPVGATASNLRDAFKAKSGRFGERVRFTGAVGRPELVGWLASADIVVLPSRFESFGLVYVEAASLSKPIVALDIAAAREVLGGDEPAAVFAAPTAEALADRMLALAGSAPARQKLAEAARRRFVERFTLQASADAFVAALEKSSLAAAG